MLNIGGSDDPAYRYKMPRVQTKIEGRGNGIKTVIVNAVPLAKSLHRPPAYLTKFFGCELGAQSKYDDKAEKSVVNGAHDQPIIQHNVHLFVDKFVLCPRCRLPETDLKVKKGGIWHVCSACGANELVDMEHKLCTFILKDAKRGDEGGKSSKKDRRRKEREKKHVEGAAAAPSPDHAEEGEEADSDGKEEKKKKKSKHSSKDKEKRKEKKEKKEKRRRKKKGSDDEAEEGAEEQRDENGDLVATLDNLHVDDASAVADMADRLRAFIDEGEHSADEIAAQVSTLQVNAGLAISDRLFLLYQAALADASPAALQGRVRQFAPAFNSVMAGLDHPQERLISALERVLSSASSSIKKYTPAILKFFYDAGMLQERTVLAWAHSIGLGAFSHPGLNDDRVDKLKELAQPFVQWLEASDDDDDGSEGEEEEEEEEEEEDGDDDSEDEDD